MVDEMSRQLKQVIMYGEGTTCEFKMTKIVCLVIYLKLYV